MNKEKQLRREFNLSFELTQYTHRQSIEQLNKIFDWFKLKNKMKPTKRGKGRPKLDPTKVLSFRVKTTKAIKLKVLIKKLIKDESILKIKCCNNKTDSDYDY